VAFLVKIYKFLKLNVRYIKTIKTMIYYNYILLFAICYMLYAILLHLRQILVW